MRSWKCARRGGGSKKELPVAETNTYVPTDIFMTG